MDGDVTGASERRNAEILRFAQNGLGGVCGLAEGVFERGAGLGEEDAAGFGEVPVVFEADAEGFGVIGLAGQVDAGLVGEAHSGRDRLVVAADEVRPFVAVHAYSMA